jgi:hypothetical protein
MGVSRWKPGGDFLKTDCQIALFILQSVCKMNEANHNINNHNTFNYKPQTNNFNYYIDNINTDNLTNRELKTFNHYKEQGTLSLIAEYLKKRCT